MSSPTNSPPLKVLSELKLLLVTGRALGSDDRRGCLGCKLFGSFEPRFRGQKDEGDDSKAENIVLPGASFIVPEYPALHLIRARLRCVDHVSVTHVNDPRAGGRRLRIMRDHNDRLPEFLI